MRKLSFAIALAVLVAAAPLPGAGYKLVAWNDLGMHCVDGVDYSVFGVLPPYNTVNLQLIDPAGKLVANPAGITITYEAVADPAGSINTTSAAKTNFWQYAPLLFGAAPPPDVGLTGNAMPGALNQPRPARFDTARSWFTADGIPVTPLDDKLLKNYFPMMRFTARNAAGTVLATTDVVLPVSDEMDCRACHASGGSPSARPAIGWAWDPDPGRDVKLNVLAIHDQHQAINAKYAQALQAQGYLADGLRATALGAIPVLCARCHPSNALPGLGIATIQPLTEAIHSRHSDSVDPANGISLQENLTRQSCYRCHPGAQTQCLRGVMGTAVRSDATYMIDCQGCHGSMTEVGAHGRIGWLQEPACQNCHTGTAIANAGQIRYESAFSSPGVLRATANALFATNPDTPAPGVSLYRFSTGHGMLQCESCHGSTHAELATPRANDNVQSIRLQGHAGLISECASCHATVPSSATGGPHGLHPLGASWVGRHGDVAERGTAACRACHGSDSRGTVLSRALGDRSLTSEFGARVFWRGFQVSCYACHNGPGSEAVNPNRPAVATNATASTTMGTPVTVLLKATDPDGNLLVLRAVSKPMHGRAGIAGTTATYVPDPAYSGPDSFTFAAWDGAIDSNLGTVAVTVGPVVTNAKVTLAKSGTGSGVVTSSPAGINCGATCNGSFPVGSTITLSAKADQDAKFSGWSGPCTGTSPCKFKVSADATVTAKFTYAPTLYKLSVTKSGRGKGVVTSVATGINCGTACSAAFGIGTSVTLKAVPSGRSRFAGWSGACTGKTTCVVSMTQQRSVTATFN